MQPFAPGQQSLPCTLFKQIIEFADGTDQSEWVCEVYGIDALNSGRTFVSIEGMEHVLAAKPDIHSGQTTLFAKGARFIAKDNIFGHQVAPGLSKHHKLFITKGNGLIFGQADDSRRRRLAATTGDLTVLVFKVSTPDVNLTKAVAELSGEVFGTDGDTNNLKTNAEGCSKNAVRINPASGTVPVSVATSPAAPCVDDSNAIFDVQRTDDPAITYNCDFFNYWMFTTPGDLCDTYGTSPQIDDRE